MMIVVSIDVMTLITNMDAITLITSNDTGDLYGYCNTHYQCGRHDAGSQYRRHDTCPRMDVMTRGQPYQWLYGRCFNLGTQPMGPISSFAAGIENCF